MYLSIVTFTLVVFSMLHRLRHRLGYLMFLLVFLPSLVITSIGEAQAHGAASTVSDHTSDLSGHGHTHGHMHEDGHQFPHESGSHFHEQADRLGASIAIAPNVRHALRLGERRGSPQRRVYRLKRPPRPVTA